MRPDARGQKAVGDRQCLVTRERQERADKRPQRVARVGQPGRRRVGNGDMSARRQRRGNARHRPHREDDRNSFSSSREVPPKRRSTRTSDLKRTIKVLRAVGINPERVEIEPDGKITVVASATTVPDNALDRWIARHENSA